ncbi:MAG TPA: hypothetical protein VKR52_08625 [Terracidiphilus sp.]|nr:hypothetical protein [Terracidiphilus sp.]
MTGPNQANGENDPQKLWQNQPREETTLTLKLIRQRAQELHTRTRRELLSNLAMIPVVAAGAWLGFIETHDSGFRSVLVAALVWAVAGQYLVHRGMGSATAPERSALMTGLDFYRREITRRRNLLARFLQWTVGPIILCIGTLILLFSGMARAVGKPGAVLPFTTLGVIWFVLVLVLRSRHQRELKAELDLLNQMESAGKRTAG